MKATTRRIWVVAVLLPMCLGMVGVANAGLPEPGPEVAASFSLAFPAPVLYVPCNPTFSQNTFTLVATGSEQDMSSPSKPSLAGNAALRMTMTENSDSVVVGHISATLTAPSSGATLYKGTGTVVGREGSPGVVRVRGFLNAVLYAKGKPTSRHLIANIALKVELGDGNLTGAFGDAAAGPTVAVETTGKAC